jgi:hypothetical protein
MNDWQNQRELSLAYETYLTFRAVDSVFQVVGKLLEFIEYL